MDKWTSVSRKLPKDGEWCLVATKVIQNGNLERRESLNISRFFINGYAQNCWGQIPPTEIVTHWIKLPGTPA